MPAVQDTPLTSISTNFELWYQPIYDMTDGRVVHNEVLLRWRDAQGYLHRPNHFMPLVALAEQQQWLDRLVIKKTIQKLIDTPQVALSINLSSQILRDFDVLDYIHDLTQEHGVFPNQLNFEIHEKTIAADLDNAIAFIRELKTLGCSVVLDNFSNQYLTFLQWERLNVDSIKIDGPLLQAVSHSLHDADLVQAMVELSNDLGQTASAKSVDAVATSNSLERIGFDSAQGYHLKPPSSHLCLASKVDILGIPIDNLTQQDLLKQLTSGTVFTPNVDHLINVKKNRQFWQAYTIADYKLCDSQILFFASKFLGSPLQERISGSDLFPAFYDYHKDNPETTIFMLGGAAGVPEQAQAKINAKVGRDMVVDAYSPSFGFEADQQECSYIVERINRSGATVLAIGVGAPKQEQWIYQHRDRLTSVKIIFAIGATIDFEAGAQKRAPKIVSALGIEWLYRLACEPTRLWKRYLVNDLPFFWLLLQQKLHS